MTSTTPTTDAIAAIEAAALADLAAAEDDAGIEAWRTRILGRSGELTGVLRGIGGLDADERKAVGAAANRAKAALGAALDERREALRLGCAESVVCAQARGGTPMKSDAGTVEDYLAALPDDRRVEVEAVIEVVREHLPAGYEEQMEFGMPSWVVPLSRYPKTYNKRPLMLASLASQKHYLSLYLMNIYGNPEAEGWFNSAYESSGKRLDMGKSCVRFKRAEDLPLAVIGEAIGRTSVEALIEQYAASRSGR